MSKSADDTVYTLIYVDSENRDIWHVTHDRVKDVVLRVWFSPDGKVSSVESRRPKDLSAEKWMDRCMRVGPTKGWRHAATVEGYSQPFALDIDAMDLIAGR